MHMSKIVDYLYEIGLTSVNKIKEYFLMNDLDTTPALTMNDSIISGAVSDMKSTIESML